MSWQCIDSECPTLIGVDGGVGAVQVLGKREKSPLLSGQAQVARSCKGTGKFRASGWGDMLVVHQGPPGSTKAHQCVSSASVCYRKRVCSRLLHAHRSVFLLVAFLRAVNCVSRRATKPRILTHMYSVVVVAVVVVMVLSVSLLLGMISQSARGMKFHNEVAWRVQYVNSCVDFCSKVSFLSLSLISPRALLPADGEKPGSEKIGNGFDDCLPSLLQNTDSRSVTPYKHKHKHMHKNSRLEQLRLIQETDAITASANLLLRPITSWSPRLLQKSGGDTDGPSGAGVD